DMFSDDNGEIVTLQDLRDRLLALDEDGLLHIMEMVQERMWDEENKNLYAYVLDGVFKIDLYSVGKNLIREMWRYLQPRKPRRPPSS
ncbi:hypothetical protein HK102_003975, partial [Quaeritorhiza haematococci]